VRTRRLTFYYFFLSTFYNTVRKILRKTPCLKKNVIRRSRVTYNTAVRLTQMSRSSLSE